LIIVVLATLYKWWVFSPSSSKDAASHMHEMEQAGFHGSCGSTDGVHVTMENRITQWLLAINFAISMIGIFNVARLPITKPIRRAG
jgi:hypothetical protein